MQNFEKGVVLSLHAKHSLCRSYFDRYGDRNIGHAKTSLWAKVHTSEGRVVEVWMLKEHGNGKRSKKQESELQNKHDADLVGTTVGFEVAWNGLRFFRTFLATKITSAQT